MVWECLGVHFFWFGGYQYFRKPPYGYIAQQCPVVMIINDREFKESLNHKIQIISGGNRSAMIILIKNHQMAYQKWVYTILTWKIISKPTLYMSHCYLFMQMAFFWIAFRVVRIWGVLQMTFNKCIPISRGQVINLFIGEHPENIMENFHRITPMTTKDILNPIWKKMVYFIELFNISRFDPYRHANVLGVYFFFCGFYDICSHCDFQGRPKKLACCRYCISWGTTLMLDP